MTSVELPDFGLFLLFGPWRTNTAALPPVVPNAVAIAPELQARRRVAFDATVLSKADLRPIAAAADEAYANVYVLAFGESGVEAAKRTGSMRIKEAIHIPDGAPLNISWLPLVTDRRGETGPFDIIGDVHGCADELIELLGKLGYGVSLTGSGADRRAAIIAPPGRRAFFAGDLEDRGPSAPDVLRIVMRMVEDGTALCIAGNHDVAFLRWLEGKNHHLHHGLDRSAAQFEAETPALRQQVGQFIEGLSSHMWVDGGRLAVAHAGVREAMIGRATGKVRAFALYGDTDTGGNADGSPRRYHWALRYHGPVTVVYGHTPVAVEQLGWVNNTLCIDTGCCFGGALTALRWPERELVSVAAKQRYAVKAGPFGHPPPRPDRVEGNEEG